MSMSDLFSHRAAGRYVNDFYETEYIDDNEKRHRDDGPAYIDAEGNKGWYQHGVLHRAGGLPAVEYADGRKEYWENGQQLTNDDVAAIWQEIAADKRRAAGQAAVQNIAGGATHPIPIMKPLQIQKKSNPPPSSPPSSSKA